MIKKLIIFFALFSASLVDGESKKFVMFIVHTETINGKGVLEMYKALKKQGHRLKIVAIPFLVGDRVLYDLDLNFTRKFDAKDVVYPCGMSKPYTHCDGIGSDRPDYVIIQNPYNSFKGTILDPYFTLEGLKKIAKNLAYVVYGPHIFHQDACNNTTIKDLIDLVFVDSESTKKLFIEKLHFLEKNVIVTGYQNYENVREKLQAKRGKSTYKETILWLPRWTMSFKYRDQHEGGSTFLNYHYFFLNFAKENPDTRLIIRPHVLLFKYGVENKFFSQADLDEILSRFRALKNVTFSEHISDPLEEDVVEADIVISDGSSALGEVVVAGKPIVYLSNGINEEFCSNDLGIELRKFVYLAHDPNEILEKIEFIRLMECSPFAKKSENAFRGRKLLGISDWVTDPQWFDFKRKVDPVENPAEKIASYISSN